MKSNVTDEAIASESLYDFFTSSKSCSVHSWHPPDSKAYFTRLLYIPKLGKRSHIDLIVQIRDALVLIEVKDCLCNSYEDVEKLKSVSSIFSTSELVQTFAKQGLTFSTIPKETKIAIAARFSDRKFLITNPDIATLLVYNGFIRGANRPGSQLLNELFVQDR